MEFFNDGTYYSYQHYENSINIGWISPVKMYENNANKELARRLLKYMDYPLNTLRGGDYYKKITFENKNFILGFSEFRVIGANGFVYAVPDMIIYSILYQNYNPPADFIEAVYYGMDPERDEYIEYIKRYNEDNYWGMSLEYVNIGHKLLELIKDNNMDLLINELRNDQELINIVTEKGSLLNAALEYDNEKIARYLIDTGININLFNGIELLTAIRKKQNAIANLLIDQNITIRKNSPKVNPLFYAIAMKNNIIAKKLLENKKDLSLKYSNEFVSECDVIKWSIRCENNEFTSLLKNQNEV